jgi:tetratricopeptide (TPR) repeat protein
LRPAHRAEVERLLERVVAEEGARVDAGVLLGRGRAALDDLAAPAAEEYAAYVTVLDAAHAGHRPAFTRESLGTPALFTAVGAVTAFAADLGLGTDGGTAAGAGAIVAVTGAAATVARAAAGHWSTARSHAVLRGQPGGPEQARLAWLSAVELRGVRPFVEQHRVVAAAPATVRLRTAKQSGSAQPRRTDRSAAARQRTVLEQSFAHLPENEGPFTGRKEHLRRIAQWVHQARVSPATESVVVVLHGPPGSGRSALAVRAAHELRDQFRGSCVVSMRGSAATASTGQTLGGSQPLQTRDALLHLLNRLGAPREQLLFRERPSHEQHLRRLAEQYQKHLTGIPVVVVLDDAADPDQVRTLVPARSDSLVLVTSAQPLPLDIPDAKVYQLPVEPLGADASYELLNSLAEPIARLDRETAEEIRALCGGLPLALRIAGSSLADRPARRLADDLAAYGPQDPLDRALALRYYELPEASRRLLRRLAIAGRASLGGAAGAALLGTDEREATRRLTELARAGLLENVRGSRFRLHEVVRRFAGARLADEEDPAERSASQERLIGNYAELAESVIRMVDGKSSARTGRFSRHGFPSLELALRWLDDESSFITAALRTADDVDERVVQHLLGALCDYCLLRGDLYRLGEINDLAQAYQARHDRRAATGATGGPGGSGREVAPRTGTGSEATRPGPEASPRAREQGREQAGEQGGEQGVLVRSVQWRTGIAARQLGELDKARSTLSSVVNLYFEAQNLAGAARALCSLGITLHHQGNLREAEQKLREALDLQVTEETLGDRGWTMHALAAVVRDAGHIAEALALLRESLVLHRESESVHGEAWAHLQLGQVFLLLGAVERGDEELNRADECYELTSDRRGEAWTRTQQARARLLRGEGAEAVRLLNDALQKHRACEDARGEAWTLFYLGQALEENGDLDGALRFLERARTMFSRMRDVYGLACARHHSGRVTRDQRAARTGNLRNSGFARQLLQDSRQDFRRVGVAHGEAWSCLELAVIDAGNGRTADALALCEEAERLFTSFGDRRGTDWSVFLRCTLLPLLSTPGTDEALTRLRALLADAYTRRDPDLEDHAEAYILLLERGVEPGGAWDAWRLGMVPGRGSRVVMAVPAGPPK